jgi:hypothetical protein
MYLPYSTNEQDCGINQLNKKTSKGLFEDEFYKGLTFEYVTNFNIYRLSINNY